MKSKLITAGIVLLLLACVTAFNMYVEPNPIRAAQEREREEMLKKVAEEKEARRRAFDEEFPENPVEEEGAEAADGGEGMVVAAAAPVEAPGTPTQEATTEAAAPDVYRVKFETSKGDVVIEVQKEWAPLGAQRFYDLVRTGFYDGNRFFRVVPGFVVQWGINGDPAHDGRWESPKLMDDPVKQSNTEGFVTFAAAGQPNTRTTQVFINYGDNSNLDGMRFAPFGKVVEGLEVAKSFNAQYADQPTSAQHLIRSEGNAWLDKQFPGLDYIKQARIVE